MFPLALALAALVGVSLGLLGLAAMGGAFIAGRLAHLRSTVGHLVLQPYRTRAARSSVPAVVGSRAGAPRVI